MAKMVKKPRYNATDEQKQRLNKAFQGYINMRGSEYSPGSATKPAPVKKKKKVVKRRRLSGQAYSRNADKVYENAKKGLYD